MKKIPPSKSKKFVAKRVERKRSNGSNIFKSKYEPNYKWGSIQIYEFWLRPFYDKKIIGANWQIHKLKKDAVSTDFTKLYPIIQFDTWDDAESLFKQYKFRIRGNTY